MSLKKLLLPAAILIAVMSFLASHASAQTMGEYATTTVGVATGGGSMGTSLSTPVSIGSTDFGESSQTWGVSGTGSSWSERAGAASGSGLGTDFASRAGSMSSGFGGAESRWPGTGISSAASSLDSAPDRFSGEDRFTERSDFSPQNRWPASSLSANKGLDTRFNSISGN